MVIARFLIGWRGPAVFSALVSLSRFSGLNKCYKISRNEPGVFCARYLLWAVNLISERRAIETENFLIPAQCFVVTRLSGKQAWSIYDSSVLFWSVSRYGLEGGIVIHRWWAYDQAVFWKDILIHRGTRGRQIEEWWSMKLQKPCHICRPRIMLHE